MKIVKSVILASALCVSVFSLSGCSQTAKSQPVSSGETETTQAAPASKGADYLSTKVGQKCIVGFVNKISPVEGTLSSVSDSGIVINDPGNNIKDGVADKPAREIFIPSANIALVAFEKAAK